MGSREVYNKNRKKRYHDDPEYADLVKQRVQEYRDRVRTSKKRKRTLETQAFVARWRKEGISDEEIAKRLTYLGSKPLSPITVEFGGRTVRLIPISILGAEIGFAPSTIRKWERMEVVPEAAHRDSSNRRWYSQIYLSILKAAVGACIKKGWSLKGLKQEVDKRWRKEVAPHGSEADLLRKQKRSKRLRLR